MKFNNLIKIYEEEIFKAASNDDQLERRTQYFKIMLDNLNKKFGQIKPDDFLIPLENLNFKNKESYLNIETLKCGNIYIKF